MNRYNWQLPVNNNVLLNSLQNVTNNQWLRNTDYTGTIAAREWIRNRWADSYINTDDSKQFSSLEKAWYKKEMDKADQQLDSIKSYVANKNKKKKGKRVLTRNLNVDSLPY